MNGILILGRTRGSWWSSHFLAKRHVFKLLSAIKVKVVDKLMQSNYVLFYMLRVPVCKIQTNSKFRSKGGKFDFFQFLMLDKLGSN